MKVHAISTNETFIEHLKEHFGDVNVEAELTYETHDRDILVLTHSLLPYYELGRFKDLFSRYRYLFFVYDDTSNELEQTVKSICDGYSIHFLSGYLTEQQMIQEMQNIIEPQESETQKVFAFFSSVSNVGTTSTALSVAHALSEQTDAKVGLLMLNAWDSGDDFLTYRGRYLDELKGNVFNRVYQTDESFLNLFHTVTTDRLYVLLGNRNPKLERQYTKEEIHYVIERAKRLFDIVLIDSGSHVDNANFVQSLYVSDYRFVILNQQKKTQRKWSEMYEQVLSPIGFSKKDFMLIINQYEQGQALAKTKDFYQQLGLPVLGTIPKSQEGWLSESHQKSLYLMDELPYQESIHVIAKTISTHVDWEWKPKETRRKLFGIGI